MDCMQARNQTFLKGGSKSGMVTQMKATQNRNIKLKYKLNASQNRGFFQTPRTPSRYGPGLLAIHQFVCNFPCQKLYCTDGYYTPLNDI